jgi:hypothetical protein
MSDKTDPNVAESRSAMASTGLAFEQFAEFDKIIVTGPQRSGTRICAKMIAHDTGHKYIDEREIYVDSLYWLQQLFRSDHRFVVQCPAVCRHVHMFSADDTAIILMRRDIRDILASQQRIDWSWEQVELIQYDRREGVIAEVKYQFWGEYQRQRIAHAFEVEYESLAAYPLWVPKHLRRGFRADQTTSQDEGPVASPNARPRSRADVIYWECSDQERAIVVKGSARALNAVGQLIWNLCDGTRTRQDILQSLKAEFEAVDEKTLATDLDDFIRDLVANGFLHLATTKK